MIYFIFFVITFLVVFFFKLKKTEKSTSQFVVSSKGKESLVFELTGIHFPETKTFISNFCNQGDVVSIELEPNNKFDSNAIAVIHNANIIGYVPAHETSLVKEFIFKYNYIAFIYKKEYLGSYLNVEIGLLEN